jgi:hypothetical protein
MVSLTLIPKRLKTLHGQFGSKMATTINTTVTLFLQAFILYTEIAILLTVSIEFISGEDVAAIMNPEFCGRLKEPVYSRQK